jgi:hypothetical protein
MHMPEGGKKLGFSTLGWAHPYGGGAHLQQENVTWDPSSAPLCLGFGFGLACA